MSVNSENAKFFYLKANVSVKAAGRMWPAEACFSCFPPSSLVNIFLRLLEMFFGDMPHDISGIMKYSAYNYFIFGWQE